MFIALLLYNTRYTFVIDDWVIVFNITCLLLSTQHWLHPLNTNGTMLGQAVLEDPAAVVFQGVAAALPWVLAVAPDPELPESLNLPLVSLSLCSITTPPPQMTELQVCALFLTRTLMVRSLGCGSWRAPWRSCTRKLNQWHPFQELQPHPYLSP